MFFFEDLTIINIVTFIVVILAAIGINELLRMSKKISIGIFLVLPFIMTFYWISNDSEVVSWFFWVKVYSALAGSLIYMVVRFTDYPVKHPGYLLLIPGILALNILEAVVREFQVVLAGFHGMVDGAYYISGGWNYVNAVAGIINILLLCGWVGIKRKERKNRVDMVWPDLGSMYIMAYALWNISYVYSCSPNNALYSGFALNLAPIIPAFFWAKGTWMQNRAHTLSVWMILIMTFPYLFADGSMLQASLSYHAIANWSLAIASLGLNGTLFVWQAARILKTKKNPLREEIWVGTSQYQGEDEVTENARTGRSNRSGQECSTSSART
ncbi:DUF5692 family protein [Tindallia californiensis]|uniref:Uncharacterized protein n=1 Tax=Tindallia californiensis TaxID=159292 RepID=A0A1H3QRX1_9FIRM|nr:DUF5692 family protein [Tindallia californiensis]SDZ15765.1 hypothetical protein SAMN05192546_11062 [Tindallia californiensis]